MTRQASQNIRYILWKQKIPHQEWINYLARHLKDAGDINETYAEAIISGAEDISIDKLSLLAKRWSYEPDTLLYTNLVRDEGVKILHENIRYLLDNLEWGKKKELAFHIQVHPTTLSRWYSGENIPSAQHLNALKLFLGVTPFTDLHKELLFLSHLPLADIERKKWLRQRIDKLSHDELTTLFPALQKLLS